MFVLRARAVLPIGRPVIPNGAVGIERNRITAVGRWRDVARHPHVRALDLGDVALLPGLVNAHCHLDYTRMAGNFPPPKVFTDWLKLIVEAKSGWELSDYTESWSSGAQMLVRTGTTTVGDIEAVPELLPKAWHATPLRMVSFLEMMGITAKRLPRATLRAALDKLRELKSPRCRVGLSPHSPYSTMPELLRLTGETARRRRLRVCTHVAESTLEFEMFRYARGELHAWIEKSGRDVADCGLGTPVSHLARHGLLGPNLLATHVNYLGRGDAALLGKSGTHVVHCPRSHQYFRHDPFPLRSLRRAGVNICLGTDSLASVYQGRRQTVELSLFDEMRALAASEPALPPRTILRMATVNSALALGFEGSLGELKPGAFADLIAIPVGSARPDLSETVVHHRGHVSASMIDGNWAIAPAEVQAELPRLWQ